MTDITIIFSSGRMIHFVGDMQKLLEAVRDTAPKNAQHNMLLFEGIALLAIDNIDAIVPSENVHREPRTREPVNCSRGSQ